MSTQTSNGKRTSATQATNVEPPTKKAKSNKELILEANKDLTEAEWVPIVNPGMEEHIERRALLKIPESTFKSKGACWEHFKIYQWQKLKASTKEVLEEKTVVHSDRGPVQKHDRTAVNRTVGHH